MEQTKKLLIFFFIIELVLGGTPWIPEGKLDDEYWMGRHQGLVENTLGNNGSIHVLFYGDSITSGWGSAGKQVYAEYYTPLGSANYGIGSDRIEHVLWRMKNGEVTENLNPTVCIVKIGTNNLLANDPTSIAIGITYIVRELRETLPQTKVLLLGVLPRQNEERTNMTSAINNVIQHLDNGNTIRFLDMKPHFYKGGDDFYTELYTEDLVHLSEAGYRKWAEAMDPLFREMFGSSKNV